MDIYTCMFGKFYGKVSVKQRDLFTVQNSISSCLNTNTDHEEYSFKDDIC